MPPELTNTALLVFSRSALQDALAKPLINNGLTRQCTAISAQLIRHTRAIARASGLPVFFYSEQQQQGNSFGERFAHAFEALFARGYTQVIAVGNDCPTLTARDIRNAAQKLATQNIVLGPAADGGAWLVGMRSTAYDHDRFLAVDWQTERVFTQLSALAAGSLFCLPEKSDIDTAADLQEQLRAAELPVLLKINITCLIVALCPAAFWPITMLSPTATIPSHRLRGPPLAA